MPPLRRRSYLKGKKKKKRENFCLQIFSPSPSRLTPHAKGGNKKLNCKVRGVRYRRAAVRSTLNVHTKTNIPKRDREKGEVARHRMELFFDSYPLGFFGGSGTEAAITRGFFRFFYLFHEPPTASQLASSTSSSGSTYAGRYVVRTPLWRSTYLRIPFIISPI